METTITATKKESGEWMLVDEAGTPVQEGYGYPTKKEALEGARLLWPVNSVWAGRAVRNGWAIKTD